MPTYAYECKKCHEEFELVRRIADRHDPAKCPECKGRGKMIVSFRSSSPTFSEQLYADGFYHSGIGEVVHSEKELKQKCKEQGFITKHEGAYMTPKQERMLLRQRVSARPKELNKRAPRYTGRENWPVIETYEKD